MSSGFAANGYAEHSPGNYSLVSAFVAEFVLTFFFLFVILGATDSRAPAASWMRLPASWRMEMSAFSATVVCPPDKALGWLMMGVELMVTDRLPWATAQADSVTA